jgi:glycosyltransferase involved in cell wall biosynthesis
MDKGKEAICTVLMISYNHAPYIREAFASVLEQKTDYEFVVQVFDDCSTDGTQAIIEEYVKEYPDKIHYFPADKNLGAQGNIWRAYESVRTKYCVLLECDDYFCDDKKLQLQITALEEHPECSFCGHNTKLITLNEECREYEEGSISCRNKILKTKAVFEYEDFHFVSNGGYIPYIAARMIRTDCFDLSTIRYKESFLFDHTQFYFLILRGNYYYIDRVMSVYRRTGAGTCSTEEPLVFLNTFIQNSLDFNKETNFIIADKIFIDCELQMNFRQKLFRQYKTQAVESLIKDDCINWVSNVALGDTFIWAGLRRALEEKYQAPIHFIIKPQYEIVMKMYHLDNYSIFADFDVIEWDLLKRCPYPMKGKLFMGHPAFYSEQRYMYDALRYRRIATDFMRYLKEFAGLEADASVEEPTWYPELSDEAIGRLRECPVEKVAIMSVEANSCTNYGKQFWEELACELSGEGLKVIINTVSDFTCKHAESWNLSLSDVVALSVRCHGVYAVRSGLCDVIHGCCRKLHIYYNDFADMSIFSIHKMFGPSDNVEEEMVFLESIQEYSDSVARQTVPLKRPKLFGFIKVPGFAYNFYDKHRTWFKNKRLIRKLIKWQ